jgi:hypothetical protein
VNAWKLETAAVMGSTVSFGTCVMLGVIAVAVGSVVLGVASVAWFVLGVALMLLSMWLEDRR